MPDGTLKRIALACGTAAALVVGAPGVAHAATGQYTMTAGPGGICNFVMANDTTADGQFGGPDVWNGVVWLQLVTPLRGGLPVRATVSCSVQNNGVDWFTVLGPISGAGLIVGAGQIQFGEVLPTDSIEICAHVTMDGVTTVTCNPAVVTSVDDIAGNVIDGVLCPVFQAIAPVVNVARPVIDIDPVSGDIHILNNWIYDCPPYGV